LSYRPKKRIPVSSILQNLMVRTIRVGV